MADKVFPSIPERTTQKFSVTLKDENGVAIPGASLTTCTLTLVDKGPVGAPRHAWPKTIVNGRDDVDVKANVNGSGLLTFTFTPDDNRILDDRLDTEVHGALFEWTYLAGAARGQFEADFPIVNSVRVP